MEDRHMAAAQFDMDDIKRRMDGALDSLRKEFAGLRTGRASANLLDPIVVDAYGSNMPLNQVASVSAPEPRLIIVQVWDRGQVKAVDRAIRESGLGLNPQAEGSVIRIPIPELNEERRRELTKVASKYTEHTRVAIRNVRRDGMDRLKRLLKDSDISEDENETLSKKVQELTDSYIKKTDDALAAKEKEIMQV
jgi:ribosome recycling factor